jgi:hypothetical protein
LELVELTLPFTRQINGIPVPVSRTVPPEGKLFQDNVSCTVHDCSLDVSVQTGVELLVFADATLLNWNADAEARLSGAAVNLQVHPQCVSGEAPPIEPIIIGVMP